MNEERHILPAVQIFGRDSSFRQYKVCADIQSGSLLYKEDVKGQWGRALTLVWDTISWLWKAIA